MLKRLKPTTPGQRGMVLLVSKTNKKSKSARGLLKPLKGPKGRSKGKISQRHQSRGAKKFYRIIDFKRNKSDVEGLVYTIEYDPNRNCNIAMVNYIDGDKRYILAPEGLKAGDKVVSSSKAAPKIGNATELSNIPLGVSIHNIEINPGRGGQIVRSAGTSAVITAKEGKYVNIKMPSGEVKRFLASCIATIGVLGNADFKNTKIGKAGRKRHMGIRPTVRGIAFSNPRDHSHGGSYKSTGIGLKTPVSRTGVPSKGYKTRKRKHTDIYKVRDRRSK